MKHNNGVLIHLLLAERSVNIVTDRALTQHVLPAEWQAIIARLSRRSARKMEDGRWKMEDGLTQALGEVSALLMAPFPGPPKLAAGYLITRLLGTGLGGGQSGRSKTNTGCSETKKSGAGPDSRQGDGGHSQPAIRLTFSAETCAGPRSVLPSQPAPRWLWPDRCHWRHSSPPLQPACVTRWPWLRQGRRPGWQYLTAP